MAFARTATVIHNKVATAADDPTKEVNKGEWNDSHAVTATLSGATVGGIPYFSSATVEAMSGMTWNASAAAGEGLALAAGTATTDVAAISAAITWNNAAVAFTAAFKYAVTDTASLAGSFHSLWTTGSTIMSLQKSGILNVNSTISVGGVGVTSGSFYASALAVQLYRDYPLTWSGTAFTDGTPDTGLSRTAAGEIAFGTGAAGNVSGVCRAASYKVGAAAGANFGPGLPTSITVVGGIITAIS
jgi:hypothetical protein